MTRSALGLLALLGCASRHAPEPAAEAALVGASGVPGPSDALYFVLVDRFADGRPDAPGTVDRSDPQAFHGGDLRGLIDRLDHIRALGFGGIWLSPITAMQTRKVDEWGAFHGYWVTDLGALEPRFGEPSDLDDLVEALAERDMRLYLDMVYNHVGYDAPLRAEHPDWFHDHGDIEDWDDPVEVVTHDVHGLPDLAQERDDVYAYLLDRSRRWIERASPAGFRVDAVRHLPDGFLARLGDDLRADGAGEGVALLGEVFDGDPDRLARRFRSDRLTSVFDFPLHYAMKDVFCDDRPVGRLASVISADRAYGPVISGPGLAPLVTFLDNHDVSRIRSACGDDPARVQRALAFLLTARGTPCVTYGTEVGLDGAHEPDNRGDMRFYEPGAEPPEAAAIRHWLELRARWPALTAGATATEQLSADLWVTTRTVGREVALIAVNQGDEPQEVGVPDALAGVEPDEIWVVEGEGGPVAGVERIVPPRAVWIARFTASHELRPPEEPAGAWTLTARDLPLGPDDVPVLVGGGERLGSWDAAAGLVGQRDDDVVRFTLTAHPREVFAAKLVIRRADGSVTWEDRADRYLFVNGQAPTLRWGSTGP